MKKILSIFISVLLISNILYAHRQHVHQRLAVEGYYLLKKWLGVSDIPIMIDRLGGLSSYYVGTNPWEKGYITTGAWREDVEDVIYNYSIENHPTISGFTLSMITALGQALGGNDNSDGFISSTHFWYADNGDEIATDMYGSVEILGVQNTFQFTIPNAYQKIILYANGNFDLRIQLIIRDFPNGNGTPCAEQWAWVNFRYGYLPSYFNNKVLRVSKIEWLDGSVTNYPNLPVFQDYHYALTNAISYNNFKNNICWEVLGRMCHLLQDVGAPAHANIDPHGGSGLRYDSFESYFGEIGWTADMVYNQNPAMLDPYISSNPIHFLMYITQQQANHFASNGPHMNQNNNTFSGNSFPEEINYLNGLNISNYGLPVTMQENIPPEQLNNIRDKLIPQIIRTTAGLLYWFAVETGLVNRVTLKNIFNAGTIKFNQETLLSGSAKTLLSGDNHVLTAIPQSYNNYSYIWSTSAPNAKSKWSKFDKYGYPVTITNNLNITYNLNVTSQDKDATYEAGLRKNYNIDVDHQTEFDGTQADQIVTSIVEQNSGQISAPTTKTINGRLYNFAVWTDGNGSNPRTITPTYSQTYTAIYKVVNKSNNQNAFLSNSQRKVVRTDNGHLHKVYESLGRVWYERSTNNGTTWFIMNGGRPLDNGEGKLPSIDSRLDAVGIVWQEIDFGALKIMLAYFYNGIMDNDYPQVVFGDGSQSYYNSNSNPVIGWEYNSRVLVAWENKVNYQYPIGIVCRYGSFSNFGVNWFDTAVVSGTDINSTNPTIAANRISNLQGILHLAWQQKPYDAIKSIKYCKVTGYTNAPLTISATEDVSSGSGFPLNSIPSIVLNSGNYPSVVWIGTPYIGSSMNRVVNRTRGSLAWGSSFNIYDDAAGSPNINYSDGNTIIVWSYNYGGANKFLRNGSIKTFGTIGKQIQLANAPNLNSMYAISFQNQTSPYSFSTTASVGSIPKLNAIQMTSGREAIVTKDSSQFFFIIGDITLNEIPVKFIDLEEGLTISNLEELNNCLVSEPIILNDLSNLTFSIQYGVSDSINGEFQLQEDKFIEYTLELIDEDNGNILGTYYYFRFDSTTTQFNQDNSYTMDLTGIGNMTVRFRLTTETNMDGGYTVGNIFDEENVLPKNNFIFLSFGTIKEYDLAQNYPNPFNPSTRISYQIPEDGIVTMKIYDILGKEVKTLVNEQKSSGRYEIKFDASDLASGVYIYRIQVNNFVSSKKLMLLK